MSCDCDTHDADTIQARFADAACVGSCHFCNRQINRLGLVSGPVLEIARGGTALPVRLCPDCCRAIASFVSTLAFSR